MPIDHGDSPLDVAATWTVIAEKPQKKHATLDNPGQSSKKSNRNAQVFGEIEKINNMPIDHDGFESSANHHNTTTNLFKHGLFAFKASVNRRKEASLYLDITKNFEDITNLLLELKYNKDQRLHREESPSGNKRKAGPTAKPAPKKRQKQHAAVKTTTAITQAPQKPDYSFRARNSRFPDPNNCESFNLHKREAIPTGQPHQLNATAMKRKIETLASLAKTTLQSTAPTARSSNHCQKMRLPQNIGSNLKNTKDSKNHIDMITRGKSEALAMVMSPSLATNFPAPPQEETSTDIALKKPPNIDGYLQSKRKNQRTASAATATITKITLERTSNVPNTSSPSFAVSAQQTTGTTCHQEAKPNAAKYLAIAHYGATKNRSEYQDVQTTSNAPTATGPTRSITHQTNSPCRNYQANHFQANSPTNNQDTNLQVNSPITHQAKNATTHFSIQVNSSDTIKRRDTITHHGKTYNKRPPRQDQPALSHEE